jgi:multimeric flavodoxin WrbA
MRSAEREGDVETEIISLQGREIHFCTGCFRCYNDPNNRHGCEVFRDSMDELLPKLMSCQALIVASPVYFGSVTGQLKTFMDRTEPLLRYAHGPLRLGLSNKVGGAIAVGGNRNGGQETTILAIHHYFFIHDMIPVGVGPDPQPGCYIGSAGFSGQDPEKGSLVRDAIKQDELALRAAEILGRRVAKLTLKLHSS